MSIAECEACGKYHSERKFLSIEILEKRTQPYSTTTYGCLDICIQCEANAKAGEEETLLKIGRLLADVL